MPTMYSSTPNITYVMVHLKELNIYGMHIQTYRLDIASCNHCKSKTNLDLLLNERRGSYQRN